MRPSKSSKKKILGFTLIEVLVVFGIIIMIILLTRVAFNNPRIKTRNLKRISDVNTVQTALGLYYKDQGFYPTTLTPGLPLKSPDNQKTYLYEVPSNPQPRTDNNCPDSDYRYWVSNNNQSYSFSACTEDSKTGKNKLIFGTKEAVFQCGDRITDRDGFTYGTVSIGSQCWMAENLKTKTKPDGTCINQPTRCSNTGIPCSSNTDCPGGYCYNNGIAPPNCTWTYSGTSYASSSRLDGRDCITTTNTQGTDDDCNAGRTLYIAYDALNCPLKPAGCTGAQPPNTMCCGTGWVSNQNVQGICPDGWHIPNNTEFGILEQYLTNPGSTCDPNRTSGTYDCYGAGTKLKIGGTSGFDAQLTGRRQRRDDGSCIPWAYSPASAQDRPMPPPTRCLSYPPFPTNSLFTFYGTTEWFVIAEIDSLGSSGVGMRILYSSDARVQKQNQNISDGRAWPVRCIKD